MLRANIVGWCACLVIGCVGEQLDAGSNTDEPGEPAARATSGKLIFMSSKRYSADLGGLEGADAKCQSLAEAAGHSGVFRAWLSTLSTPAHERLTHSTEPYILHTGIIVANDWADLTKGTLRHAVDETETPLLPPPNAANTCNPTAFWTATDERGAQYGGDCAGWTTTSADVEGQQGNGSTGPVWSTFCHGQCDAIAPIICLEQ